MSDRNVRFRKWFFAVLLPITAVAAAFPVWRDLFSLALHDEEASHLFLVPLVFSWLVCCQWKQLPALAPDGRIPGLLVLLTAIMLHEIGLHRNLIVLWHASAVCSLTGALWFVTGTHFVRQAWPVFGVLIFLIPVPGLLRQQISLPLQLYSAILTEHVLSPCGMAISRSGCTLSVNGTLVTIVEACNGMRMLFAVFLVIYATVFSSTTSRAQQILILVFSPVSAIALNSLRLVITALLYGVCSAETAGFWHNVNGWLIPAVLMSGSVALTGAQRLDDPLSAKCSGRPVHQFADCRTLAVAYSLLAILLALNAGRLSDSDDIGRHRAEVVSTLDRIPFSIGEWLGTSGALHREELRLLSPLAAFRRSYTHVDSGRQIMSTAMVTPTARKLVGHEPGICLSGQGWDVVSQREQHWEFDCGCISGRSYVFRFQADHRLRKQVVSILVLPDGRTSGSMAAVASASADCRLNPYGAAALQVSSDDLYSESEWTEVTRQFIQEFAPIVKAFRADSERPQPVTNSKRQNERILASLPQQEYHNER